LPLAFIWSGRAIAILCRAGAQRLFVLCRPLPHRLYAALKNAAVASMKFYMRNPDAAIAGMNELTFEQIGFYNLLIDLLYARDGVVPDDGAAVAHMLGNRDLRAYRRLKAELIQAGKIRVDNSGMLDANGVRSVRLLAEVRSKSARSAAQVRWSNYQKAKENNDPLMLSRNASISTSIKEEDSSRGENGDKSETEKQEKARHPLSSTPELEAAMARFKERWT
jgi:uncharacterized protein YdaU (DUF1376 family)